MRVAYHCLTLGAKVRAALLTGSRRSSGSCAMSCAGQWRTEGAWCAAHCIPHCTASPSTSCSFLLMPRPVRTRLTIVRNLLAALIPARYFLAALIPVRYIVDTLVPASVGCGNGKVRPHPTLVSSCALLHGRAHSCSLPLGRVHSCTLHRGVGHSCWCWARRWEGPAVPQIVIELSLRI